MNQPKKTRIFIKSLSLLLSVLLLLGALFGLSACDSSFDFFGGSSQPGDDLHDDHSTPKKKDPVISGDMQIHFLELGNKYTGDCTYIKVGNVDVLIDAGSKKSSITTISAYLKEHMADDVIEYVIVTHAHEDHYAGFATHHNVDSLFDLFTFGTIIDFAQIQNGKEDTTMYQNYVREREEEVAAGATHYTADQCVSKPFDLGNGVTMEILDSYFYYNNESSGENNHSVCTLFRNGEESFLFTGDLEKKGEEHLVKMNDLPKVTLYKAGHHGSKTSSNDCLLEVIQPEIVTVCCCAGSSEYSDVSASQFPTQAFIDRIAPYTDKVYITTLCVNYKAGHITSFNGNIVVTCTPQGITVVCSNNDTLLKDSDWFKKNRTCPDAWK